MCRSLSSSLLLSCCRSLRPIILLLDTTPCPALPNLVDAATGKEKVPGGAALAAADKDSDDDDDAAGDGRGEERRMMLAQTLVGEVVLATKEVGSTPSQQPMKCTRSHHDFLTCIRRGTDSCSRS